MIKTDELELGQLVARTAASLSAPKALLQAANLFGV